MKPTDEIDTAGATPFPEAQEYIERFADTPETPHNQLAAYIRQLADLLGLRDWEIELLSEPADGKRTAEVQPTIGRKCATINVCRNWWSLSLEEMRQTIAHELIHLHFANCLHVVQIDLANVRLIGYPAFEVLIQTYIRQEEYGVDGLATAIAPLLPLPRGDTPTVCLASPILNSSELPDNGIVAPQRHVQQEEAK
jgi:hypothetical protein